MELQGCAEGLCNLAHVLDSSPETDLWECGFISPVHVPR